VSHALAGRGLHGWPSILPALLALPALAQAPRPTTASWTETVPAGATVRVVNPFGSVFARFGGYEGRVEIIGTFQRLDPSRPELEVRVSREEFGLRATVAAPPGAAESGDRVDLVVFVPRGATLDVRTSRGAIEAEKLQGDVVADSVQGDIRIRAIQGAVNARTARGRIDAALERGVTERDQRLATETGAIEAWLWEDAAMSVTLATSGLIGTDFSLEIEHRRHEEPNKHAVAQVGGGGQRLELVSKIGQVSLRRLQRGFKTQDPN